MDLCYVFCDSSALISVVPSIWVAVNFHLTARSVCELMQSKTALSQLSVHYGEW